METLRSEPLCCLVTSGYLQRFKVLGFEGCSTLVGTRGSKTFLMKTLAGASTGGLPDLDWQDRVSHLHRLPALSICHPYHVRIWPVKDRPAIELRTRMANLPERFEDWARMHDR